MEQIFEVHFNTYNMKNEVIFILKSDLNKCPQFTAGHITPQDFKEYNPQSQIILNRPNRRGYYVVSNPRSPKAILQCISFKCPVVFLTHNINHINKFWTKIKQLQFIEDL